jgi:hypothetical protein
VENIKITTINYKVLQQIILFFHQALVFWERTPALLQTRIVFEKDRTTYNIF